MKLLIKIGGTLVDNRAHCAGVAEQIGEAIGCGHDVVVVHGGGRQLTRFLEERGVESTFVNGLRVTSKETIDAVVKVLAGSVNKQLVGAMQKAGVNAVGLSGIDGRVARAVPMMPELGWVGRVTGADATLLHLLNGAGFTPVVACVAGDEEGRAWNINADQMAVACARSYAADRLFFLTDVAGVLDADGQLVPSLNVQRASDLIASGVARGGMQAKLEAASDAVRSGVRYVVIAPGATEQIVSRLLGGERAGTEISESAESGRAGAEHA